MDTIANKVIEILATYALDKTVKGIGQVAPKIIDTLKNTFGDNTKAQDTLNDFMDDPHTFAKPLEKYIDEAIKKHPLLENRLASMMFEVNSSEINRSSTTTAEKGAKQAISSNIGSGTSTAVGGDANIGSGTFIKADSVGNITIFGIPIGVVSLVGSGVLLFGFFAMPWMSMFVSLSGFDLARSLMMTANSFSATNKGIPLQFYSLWIVPLVGIITLIMSLIYVSGDKRNNNPWGTMFGLTLICLYPFFYLYTDTSGSLSTLGIGSLTGSLIAQGFWVSLVGEIIVLVVSLFAMARPK